jgi:glycosyltransferase involved in cell wall biosynthesis
MRVLFLTQILPFPPDAGPRVKTWNVLRHLAAQGNQITLVTYLRPEEQPYVGQVEQICESVITVPIHRSRIADGFYFLRSIFTGRPFLVERDDLAPMRKVINTVMRQAEFHVIHADQVSMAQFALRAGQNARKAGSPMVLVFDAHNAVWTIVERMKQNSTWFLRPALSLETERMKRYEGYLLQKFDWTTPVTEIDRQALLQATELPLRQQIEKKLKVIPIAVDCNLLQREVRQPNSKAIVTLGTLHYPPNADGIRWFMTEVFPSVQKRAPEVSLTVIGKNPPSDFLRLAEASGGSIQVTGYVPDLGPFMREAAIMVVTVRAGGGMRVRILEALARGMPLVTTTVGLEGIKAQLGREVLVADTAGDFADAVVRLLEDEALQQSLSIHGRELAEHLYDWKVVLKQLDGIYGNTGEQ